MIKNQTRNFVIIKKSKLCKSIFSKARGFMFFFKKPDYALAFIFNCEVRAELHMMFVFFPIDVLFLDKSKKVVDIKKNFKPFCYYAPKVRSQYVIELPAGFAGKTRIKDRIIMK
ncbi:MAG TPA: DUF192 domain-containing protein [Candidatus Nanoarchaeia archaeon]|nr:DUF192 domain-containing protein [Candidatus Nanoarchaeia archaeon]